MAVRFERKKVRGEDEDSDEELFKLVIDTDEVSGEILADGVSEEIAQQLEEDIGDLLESIGQSGTVEVVAVDEEGSEESNEEGATEGESSSKTSGRRKMKKGEDDGKDKKECNKNKRMRGESESERRVSHFGLRNRERSYGESRREVKRPVYGESRSIRKFGKRRDDGKK